MLFNKPPDEKVIYCPICSNKLGTKKVNDLKEFTCSDCGATHYFYPGQIKRPGKSVPKSIMHKNKCNCGRCGR